MRRRCRYLATTPSAVLWRRPKGVLSPVKYGTAPVEIFGDSAGLRDLARWCLALSDPTAPPGAHVHLDPGVMPLSLESSPLMLARERK